MFWFDIARSAVKTDEKLAYAQGRLAEMYRQRMAFSFCLNTKSGRLQMTMEEVIIEFRWILSNVSEIN